MKKLLALLLILIVFCIGNASLPTVQVNATSTLHNVGPNPDQFPTIEAALTSGLVQPGDVIHVWDTGNPYDYQENIVITIPNIKIVGEVDPASRERMVWITSNPGICISIQAPDVTIMTLGFRPGRIPSSGDIAIAIMPSAARCRIIGNDIGGGDWGILISDSPDNQIIGNSIMACMVSPPPPFCSTGVFIYGPNSVRNVVRGNWIQENSLGVQTNQASGNTIVFNNFLINDNSPQASVAAGDVNSWHDPSLSKGNYWSDSPFPPYEIDSNNVDSYCNPAKYSGYTWDYPWDINRDLKIDVKDVYAVGLAFGGFWNTLYGGSTLKWNPMADIVTDGKIDLKDYYLTCYHFGEVYAAIPGRVGYWKFDETDFMFAYDSSGYNNHGNIYGGAGFTRTSGKVNLALSFDGIDDYVDCGTDPILMPTTGITLEAWIKANVVGVNTETIVSTLYGEGYVLRINVHAGIDFLPGMSISPDGIIQPNVWYHVAGTFDGTTSKIYVNGILVYSVGAGHIAYAGQSLRIGCNPGNYLWFNGIIDEVKIYNRALSEEEIAMDMVQRQ